MRDILRECSERYRLPALELDADERVDLGWMLEHWLNLRTSTRQFRSTHLNLFELLENEGEITLSEIQTVVGGLPKKCYSLSIRAAIALASRTNTEIGNRVVLYLTAVEKELREQGQKPTYLKQLEANVERVEKFYGTPTQVADELRQYAPAINGGTHGAGLVNRILELGGYQVKVPNEKERMRWAATEAGEEICFADQYGDKLYWNSQAVADIMCEVF